MGDAPLFGPPQAHFEPQEDWGYMVERLTYRLDVPRLLTEWAALGFLVAAVYFAVPGGGGRLAGIGGNGRVAQ